MLDPAAADPSPPGEHDLEALRIVNEAAAAHWQPLPDRPEMAVPATAAGVEAVREALQLARRQRPTHPGTLEKLNFFDTVLEWATTTQFAGTVASPLGAVLIAMVLAVLAFAEGRLPGTRNELLLYASLLAAQAALYRQCARRPQFEINARFLADAPGNDERFVRWLITKNVLISTPVGLLRALLYGLLIPASMVRHLFRREYFLASALVIFANVTILITGTNLPRGLLVAEEDPFEAGVDIFGHWVAYDDPLAAAPVHAERIYGTGWKLRQSDAEGGLEASVWVHRGHLGDSSMRVWAKADAPTDNKYLQLYRRSAEQLEIRWGAPTEIRSETDEASSCETRWITLEHSSIRLHLKEVECLLGEHRTLRRSFSAPVGAQ